jgi:hypothetical protein
VRQSAVPEYKSDCFRTLNQRVPLANQGRDADRAGENVHEPTETQVDAGCQTSARPQASVRATM